MKKNLRYSLLFIYIFCSIALFYLFGFILNQPDWNLILIDLTFWICISLYLFTINEFYHWAKNGRRSEMSDLVALGFFFFIIFFFTRDLMTSMMGAFSIYLWMGIVELKDYPVINKILIISLVTYNVIFIAGLISAYLGDPFILNTTFAFSIWIILGLGFLLFGRKYIIVWRFMSPAYLMLFLYIIAWLAVGFINQYTPINFSQFIDFSNFTLIDLILNIYFVLILVNWAIYFISGPILDKMLGIKRLKEDRILDIVEDVKKNVGIKGKVKVGFGKYPILNAMAYGSVFDKRIAIIAEDTHQIPEDELKGIVAHELSHTKGKHTLILTFITTGDLIMRMLLGLPATYYDYTFGEPRIPMISFIFLNFGIYMLLYIFVRILEGKADLMTKKAGYTNELAKALYNLESFYATGREIGLNTMLLCEEKITRDNQLIDYIDTAKYINLSMIRPSRASLLGNFLNSHPPTYFRIAALLGDDLMPGKEAILPFICLKRSKQKKYAKKFEEPREKFKIIANDKFKEFFEIKDVSELMKNFNRRERFRYILKKDFIFKHKITDEIIIGKLEDIKFIDDICNIDQYIISDLKTNEKHHLNALYYTYTQIDLNEIYFFKNDTPLFLNHIDLNQQKTDGNYVFMDKDSNKILKPINKTRLPNSVQILKDFKDHDIFFKLKGTLNIYKCNNIISADNLDNYELELINLRKNEDPNLIKIKLEDLIIRPKNIFFSISRNIEFRQSEIALFNWLLNNQPRSFIYLKKPVNNLEIGYIQKYNISPNPKNFKQIYNEDQSKYTPNKENVISDESSKNEFIIIKNIFGNEKKIPYKILEIISFEYNTAMIQKKSETSIFTKFSYKILKKFKPQKVLSLNKV